MVDDTVWMANAEGTSKVAVVTKRRERVKITDMVFEYKIEEWFCLR